MYTHTHTHTHAHRQTDRQKDRQEGRQAGRQAGRQTDRQTDSTHKLVWYGDIPAGGGSPCEWPLRRASYQCGSSAAACPKFLVSFQVFNPTPL